MAVSGNRTIDQPGIALAQRAVPQSQLVKRARPIVLHEDIGAVDQAVQNLPSTRVFGVHAHATLAHVELHEVA